MLALHAPDGLMQPGVAVVTAVMSLAIVAVAHRRAAQDLGDTMVPLAGLVAAFMFAIQMINVPIGAGTSGHLLGAALAAVLLGPWLAIVVGAAVVVVQSVAFADGGLTALGYNTINLVIVPVLVGWAVFRGARRLAPAQPSAVVVATALAGAASVVAGAAAFSIEWLFGASAPVPFDLVFSAMVGLHSIIGLGEGIVSALVVGAVLRARPDIVHGARDLPPDALRWESRVSPRLFAAAGLVVAAVLAAVVSQFAVAAPDALERVADDQGLDTAVRPHPLADRFLADYALDSVANPQLSLAVAGLTGIVLSVLVIAGLAIAWGRSPLRS